jgi:hypothetical protein
MISKGYFMQPILLAAVFLGLLLSTAGLAEPPGGEAHARVRKIAELTADLGYGTEFKHVDAAIPYLAELAGQNDPAWKPSHPRWNDVCAEIGQNLHDDAQQAFAENEQTIVQGAERAFNENLSGEDLDAALAFFRSPLGRRFLELQDALMDISIEATLAKDTGPTTPPSDVIDARKRVLDLWLPIIFIRAAYPAQSADQAINRALDNISSLRGPKLDATARRFADDLSPFESFIKSPTLGKIAEAKKNAAGQATPAPDLSAFFSAEAKKHGAEWRAAYFGM